MANRHGSVNMRIIHPSLVAEAIFKADVSLINCVIPEDTDMNVAEVSTGGSSMCIFLIILTLFQTHSLSLSTFHPLSQRKHPNYQKRKLLDVPEHLLQMMQSKEPRRLPRHPQQVLREDSPVERHRKHLPQSQLQPWQLKTTVRFPKGFVKPV